MKLKQNPVSGPTSSAGLVRYFDTTGEGLKITPELVLGLSVAFLAAELLIWFIF